MNATLKKFLVDVLGYKPKIDPYEESHVVTAQTRALGKGESIQFFDPRITYLDVGPDDKVALLVPESTSKDAYLRARRLLNAALRRPGRVDIVIESGMTVTVIKPKRVNAVVSDALTDELRKMKGEMDGVEPAPAGKTVPVVPIGDQLATVANYHPLNREPK